MTTIPAGVPYAALAEVIVLPNSVTRIEGHAFSNSKALSINIPESLQEIGDEAFAYANGLNEVVLPKNLTTIGQAAFFGCSNLVSVEFPSSLTTIKSQAFSKCNKLSKVYVPSTIQEIGFGAFQECTILREVTIGNNTKVATMMIGENAFKNCSLLTDLTINSEVKNIGINAFNACNNLKNVTLGKNKSNSSMNIAREAFSKCVSLQNLTLGSEVNEIGKEAFISCTSLQSLTIPGTVSSIGESAFENCTSLAELIIGDDDMSHGTVIYEAAFCGCSGLKNTTLNKSVILNTFNEDYFDYDIYRDYHRIFRDATGDIFINCEISNQGDNSKGVIGVFNAAKFNTITLGENISKIGKGCFYDMQFKRIKIHDNITEIEEYAFYKSIGGEFVFTENSKLNKIGDFAFWHSSIDYFKMPESLTIIGKRAFESAKLIHLTIGSNIQDMGKMAFYETDCDVTIKCNLSNSNFQDAFSHNRFLSMHIIANYDTINVALTSEHASGIFAKTADKIVVEGTVKDISKACIMFPSINELHICSSVVNMGQFVMSGQAINKVYCAATTPPSLDVWYNHKPFETTTIYVPRDSVSKYETAEGWKKWGYNFVGYDF